MQPETPTPSLNNPREIEQYVREVIIQYKKSSSEILIALLNLGINTDSVFSVIEKAEKEISRTNAKA